MNGMKNEVTNVVNLFIDFLICLVSLGVVSKTKPLELYQLYFEAAYLQATKQYYDRESAQVLSTDGCTVYMKKVRK
jgi:hypothetical protein